MRVLGITAEYNPFHNGHKYHLAKAKDELNADYCVVVMSGNFVQRGEPAIIHKWKRTEMCLSGGADVVIELPLYYAVSSAELFAEGAVGILNGSNIVNYMSFGAECPSIEAFKGALEYLSNEPPEYKRLLRRSLSAGESFPSARATALASLSDCDPGVYEKPNNILAIEYLKALAKSESGISPHIIKRHVASHNSGILGERFSSASAIRGSILNGSLKSIESSVPPETFRILNEARNDFPMDFDDYSDMLLYKIKSLSAAELRGILDITEGLENRITAAADKDTIRKIITQIKTKRYTFTKIQRILIHILLGITSDDMSCLRLGGAPYIRVLGFRARAVPLIKELTEKSSLPVIINLKKDMQKLSANRLKILNKEISSTDVYFIKCRNYTLRRVGIEYSFPVVTLE